MLHLDDAPNTYQLGYQWTHADRSIILAVVAWFDVEYSVVEGLLFHWYTSDTYNYDIQLYPQDVLRQLGTPSYVFAAVEDAAMTVPVNLLLIYEQGITFLLSGSAQADRTAEGSLTATYCLGKFDVMPDVRLGYVFISTPLGTLEDFTPLESLWIEAPMASLRPVERVWGVTIEELTLMAQTEENPCLQTQFP